MRYQNSELRSQLAAEYALGLLVGRPRRRFERQLARQPELREELRFWNERFAEIPAGLPPVPPRALVWTALAQEILKDQNKIRPLVAPKKTTPPPAREPIGLYRSWALVATVATLLLGAALWREQVRNSSLLSLLEIAQNQPMPYVATIHFDGSEARWAVSLHPDKKLMRITIAPGSLPVDVSQRDLELWMLDSRGQPHALGLLPMAAGMPLELPLPDMPRSELSAMTITLAVSEEPKGGSPTGLPTGKVLGAMPAARAL
jgi:anti-sigma-K factor RskA